MDMHVAVLLPPSNGSHNLSPLRSASSVSVWSQNESRLPRAHVAVLAYHLDQTRVFSSRNENESDSEDDYDGGPDSSR